MLTFSVISVEEVVKFAEFSKYSLICIFVDYTLSFNPI